MMARRAELRNHAVLRQPPENEPQAQRGPAGDVARRQYPRAATCVSSNATSARAHVPRPGRTFTCTHFRRSLPAYIYENGLFRIVLMPACAALHELTGPHQYIIRRRKPGISTVS